MKEILKGQNWGASNATSHYRSPHKPQDAMRRKLRVREPSVLDSNNSGNNTVIHKCSTSTQQNNKFDSRCTCKWHARTETCCSEGRCQFSGLRSELFITKFTIQICQEHSLSVRHKNSRGENFRQSGRWPFCLGVSDKILWRMSFNGEKVSPS